MTTFVPFAAKARAVAFPIPVFAPVIKAVLSLICASIT